MSKEVLNKDRALDELLLKCRSPIERRFFLSWQAHVKTMGMWSCAASKYNGYFVAWNEGGFEHKLEPQYRIGSFMVDFLLTSRKLDDWMIGSKIVLECDGYEYHFEEAVMQHDRERDCWMMEQGFLVMRFMGATLSAKADACVQQVLRVARKEEFFDRLASACTVSRHPLSVDSTQAKIEQWWSNMLNRPRAFSVFDVAKGALGLSLEEAVRDSRGMQAEIGRALNRIGFMRVRRTSLNETGIMTTVYAPSKELLHYKKPVQGQW